jgi:hypothetical protein
MDVDESSDLNFACDVCIQAKHAKRPFLQETTTECSEIGELTYFDTWGPARTESLHHNVYYISFTDGKSRTPWCKYDASFITDLYQRLCIIP